MADYDKDGDLDILVSGDTANLTIYENQCTNRSHVNIRPTDSLGRMACQGAQVVIRDHITKQIWGVAQIDGGSGRGCQSQYDAHFGAITFGKPHRHQRRLIHHWEERA